MALSPNMDQEMLKDEQMKPTFYYYNPEKCISTEFINSNKQYAMVSNPRILPSFLEGVDNLTPVILHDLDFADQRYSIHETG